MDLTNISYANVYWLQRVLDALDAVKTAQGILTDAQAAECPALYPEWDGNGKSYKVGDRLSRNGILYKVKQDHVSQEAWNPAQAASLFAEVLAGQDGTAIGEWVQPDSTNPYMTGDRVIYNGKTWESTIDNNVWNPETFGWREVQS